ncbi:unnamed protein product [Mytilus coruscus]|uniref:Uncharacterized protein n=1 Tax=Mytilus coruscus TaxID=42192 RepID=A0A6J8C738_MYTCO|nr:unnamed protein product [Mytilus coruscus]
MDNFIVVLEEVCKNLNDGTITIHNLKIVASNIENFETVIKEMKGFPGDKDIILESVNLRQKQLYAYESDLHVVQHFVYVCKNCGGNTENLSSKIKSNEDMKIVELKQVCSEAKVLTARDEASSVKYVKCRENEDLQLLDNYCPKVIAFGLDNHHMEMMKELGEYTFEGDSFTQLLDNRGQLLEKEKRRKLTVDEILKEVWEPTKKFWTDLCTELEDGELLFQNLKNTFRQTI